MPPPCGTCRSEDDGLGSPAAEFPTPLNAHNHGQDLQQHQHQHQQQQRGRRQQQQQQGGDQELPPVYAAGGGAGAPEGSNVAFSGVAHVVNRTGIFLQMAQTGQAAPPGGAAASGAAAVALSDAAAPACPAAGVLCVQGLGEHGRCCKKLCNVNGKACVCLWCGTAAFFLD